MKLARVCQHSFLQDPLSAGATVLDCGVNRGDFSTWISKNIGCTLHGFEPDPRFFAKLPSLSRCEFHPMAIAAAPGRLTLHLGQSLCSSLHYVEGHAEEVEVRATTLPEFCDEHGIDRIDLLKLDIEGEEVPILSGLPEEFLRRRVAQLTVEFHDHKDRGQVPAIRAILERLRSLGFFVLPFTRHTYGDVLFVNKALVPVSGADAARMQVTKYAWGIGRMLERRIFGRRRG